MIPGDLLMHTAIVSPYTGGGSRGDMYGPDFDLPCYIEAKPRIVLDANGEQAIAAATIYADLGPVIEPGSIVTYFGTSSGRVLVVDVLDDEGYTGLDHLEIAVG